MCGVEHCAPAQLSYKDTSSHSSSMLMSMMSMCEAQELMHSQTMKHHELHPSLYPSMSESQISVVLLVAVEGCQCLWLLKMWQAEL